MHVRDGKLAEPIKLKEITRECLEHERTTCASARKRWEATSSSWEWDLAVFVATIRSKVRRAFRPVTNKLDAFENYLRDRATKRHQSSLK